MTFPSTRKGLFGLRQTKAFGDIFLTTLRQVAVRQNSNVILMKKSLLKKTNGTTIILGMAYQAIVFGLFYLKEMMFGLVLVMAWNNIKMQTTSFLSSMNNSCLY